MTGEKRSLVVFKRSLDTRAVTWINPVEEMLFSEFGGIKTYFCLERIVDADKFPLIHCSHNHGVISILVYRRHTKSFSTLNPQIGTPKSP
jgi:hypothetical protein